MLHNEISVKTWHVLLYTVIQVSAAGFYFGGQQQLINELDARSSQVEVQVKALELTLAEVQATRFRREDGNRIADLANGNSTHIAVIQAQTAEMKSDVGKIDQKLDRILEKLSTGRP